MRKIIVLFMVFMAVIQWCPAQEVVLPLETNPAKSHSDIDLRNATQNPADAVALPFHDDFSYAGPYPDPDLWADNFVFVNTSFAVHPITIGVATFDGLDQNGHIYQEAEENYYQFVADYLTSQPIRLDSVFDPPAALQPSDSVMLTFYYQPQGVGGYPTPRDSLVVEFLHTPGHYETDTLGDDVWIEDLWVSVWSTPGENLEDFSNNTFPYFKRVALPITDEVYFRNDFQFRFKNYFHFDSNKIPGNYAANNYIWNVDYVTLDRNRSITDSTYYDIAFASPAESILDQYTAMPWSHYIINPQSHLKNSFSNNITNLGDITYNYLYQYEIKDETGNTIRTYSGGTWNLPPFYQSGYQNHDPHSSPMVLPNPLPTAPAEERTFSIVHSIREGITGDNYPGNDTVIYTQEFKNYFSYDDGVPEALYGLQGHSPSLAYRFVPSHTDTIKSVQMFFNRTFNDQNVKPFYLTIWNSIFPEEIIYQTEVLSPEFEDGLNQFTTYILDEEIIVTDTFYIGFQQTGDTEDFLNIGFDMNNDASQHTFFKTGSQWDQSIKEGALMIRPVFGFAPSTGIEQPQQEVLFSVYPNPATSSQLNIRLNDQFLRNQHSLMLFLYNMKGQLVYSGNYNNSIDISPLQNGLYIIKVTNPTTGQSDSARFIISR